jgi:hypothetical protein
MHDLCPYCLVRPRDSDDHVFPDFLGGIRKVSTCAKCNNGFGHRFEGPVSKDLSPIIVRLSFSGYKHKRRVIHKRAWIDETTGIEYDLDSERRSYPSKPHFIREDGREDGKIKQIVARDRREARKIVASLKAKGQIKEVREKLESNEGLRPPLRPGSIRVGTELRQLAVKMCVAVGQVIVPDLILLDERCRQFLLDETTVSPPVRQVHSRYSSLDALCPPLAHVVYIEGDSCSAKCFGVVQLFGGALQFYVLLSSSYTGRNCGALGMLDVTTFQEQFQEIAPLRLPEAPECISQDDLERFLAGWGTELNAQVKAAFGMNTLLFETLPKASVSGVRVTLPLLWIEHQMDVGLAMELVPDQTPGQDVTLPQDPRQWVLSPDFGCTRLAVFDTFVHKWNDRTLDRTLGKQHIYVPNDIVPGVRLLLSDDFWCPVQSMTILYCVSRQAWLGAANLPNCSGELDRSGYMLQIEMKLTQDDIPMSHDPSWPVIPDPDQYEAVAENLLIAEKWDIDPDRLRFVDFRVEAD